MIIPAVYPLVLVEQADFHQGMTYKDDAGSVVPLAGGAAVMTITSEGETPQQTITLSTVGGADGTIVLSNTAPNILFDLPNAKLTGLAWDKGNYDLYITPLGGPKDRYLEGTVNIMQRVV